jgi:hypothetical protein
MATFEQRVVGAIERGGVFDLYDGHNIIVLPGKAEFESFVQEFMPDIRKRFYSEKLRDRNFMSYRTATLRSFILHIGFWRVAGESGPQEPLVVKPHKRRFP